MSGDPVILALDTATTRIVVALGAADGSMLAEASWPAGYRHGETLLPAIEHLLDEHAIDRSRIAAIVVGTGPGAFTGLRVGIATAKGLAHGLGRPIVGIATGAALLAAARRTGVVEGGTGMLLLPAGPSERLLVRDGAPAELLPAGTDPAPGPGTWLVAVDLAERAPTDAVERGEAVREGLAAELLAMGAERLARGDVDDLATLVPEYVTLPRGVRAVVGEVEWSRDRP
jgi:tRNA threonylcarbamoyl adenosine modification protein YeaZ